MSVNKVFLIGNLGDTPEVRYMPSGNPVAKLSLATNESWKDKSGTPQSSTEWHRVILYGRQAEVAGEYLRKGSKIFIAGKIKTRKWEDKNGEERYTTEIIADEMSMLDSKSSTSNNTSGHDHAGAPSSHNSLQGSEEPLTKPGRQKNQTEESFARFNEPFSKFDDKDDDIPF